MKRIDITNGIMRIDNNTETFDIQKIQNRRFMYNPQTGTDRKSTRLNSSHRSQSRMPSSA